jgi:hypothetical protein
MGNIASMRSSPNVSSIFNGIMMIRDITGRMAAVLPIAIGIVVLCTLSTARAQVNTEALRGEAPAAGFDNHAGISVEYQSGNANYYKLSGHYRLDYLGGPVYAFIVGNYERGSGGGDLFLNDAFVHLRFTYGLDSTWRLEGFAQKEFNDFIQLRDRDLAGGGIRVRLVSASDSASSFTLHLGVGAMFESELELDSIEGRSVEIRTNLLRSTNYLNAQWHVTTLLHRAATGYYQIAPSRSGDYRLLAECGLGVDLSDLLSLDTSVHYRFDHAPPAGVKRYDLHLANGLEVHF